MAVMNIPASKSLTVSSKFPDKSLKDKKIIVGSDGKYIYESYLYFDLSSLAAGIEILAAGLVLFKVTDFFYSAIPKFFIYPLLKDFSSFTTYEHNCPVEADPAVQQAFFPFSTDVALEIDITALVKKWANYLLVNRGIVIKSEKCDPYFISQTAFGSAYSKDNTLIPFIRVSYIQKYFPMQEITCTATLL